MNSNRPLSSRFLPVLLCLVSAHALLADGFIIIDPPVPPPDRRIPPPPLMPLEVTRHHVTVRIDGRMAVTSVEQEFKNPGGRDLEGTYMFPVPAGAQIEKFQMVADGKTLEAELLPAEKAREIYEEIVRKAKDPALLEYAGRDLYKARLFPIPAGGSREIRIEYAELLRADGGALSYRYPLSTEKFSASPVKSLSVKVLVRQPAPLAAIYSPSHEAKVTRPKDDPLTASVVWEAKDQRPDSDFDLIISTAETPVGAALLAHRERGEEGYFLLLLTPARTPSARPQPKDVVFVADTSGSMAGSKIEQTRRALAYCADNLNPVDRFEVIRFSTDVEPLFGRLAEAGAENRRKAVSFVESLKPRGGTALAAALEAALSALREPGRPRLVVFLTDGLPTLGETDDDKIVALLSSRGKDAGAPPRIFTFGVGSDVNSHLLDRIAESTRAFAQYVAPKEDLELKLAAFSDRISEPALTDLSLDAGGARLSAMHPSALPDLFAGDSLVVTGRFAGAGPVALRLSGHRLGAAEEQTFNVTLPESEPGNTFIPRLWAGRRIGYLLDELRLRGESREVIAEITELARAHGIITPYTAWLILEDEARRDVPAPQRTLQALDRDDGAREAARFGLERLREEKAGPKSGEAAFANARAQSALKFAGSLSAQIAPALTEAAGAVAGYSAAESGGTARAASIRSGLDQILLTASAARHVGRKTFVQNGPVWVDTAAQSVKTAPRRVVFGSDEYFRLLRARPEAGGYFALGQQIVLLLDGVLYEIIPGGPAS